MTNPFRNDFASVREFDLHNVPNDADVMAGNADVPVLNQDAGADVIRPPVPRARHDVVFDLAFAQGAGLMQAQIINGVQAIVQPEDGDVPPPDNNHPPRARRKV